MDTSMKSRHPWLRIDGGFYLMLAAMLLLLPIRWVTAMTVAAAFHELCHYGAVLAVGGRVYGLRLGPGGAKMEIEPLPPGREMVGALAGPVGSALLVTAAKWMPRVAVCGFIHCIFNLLPLFPLDGGRVLQSLFCLLLPQRGERFFRMLQQAVLWALMGGLFWLGLKMRFFPAIIGAFFLSWKGRRAHRILQE